METAHCGLIDRHIPVITATTMTALQDLRNRGLREATLNEVTISNAARLRYIKYRDGSLRINIWRRVLG